MLIFFFIAIKIVKNGLHNWMIDILMNDSFLLIFIKRYKIKHVDKKICKMFVKYENAL